MARPAGLTAPYQHVASCLATAQPLSPASRPPAPSRDGTRSLAKDACHPSTYAGLVTDSSPPPAAPPVGQAHSHGARKKLQPTDFGKLVGAIFLGVVGFLKGQTATETRGLGRTTGVGFADVVYVAALIGVVALFSWLLRSISHYEFVRNSEKPFKRNAIVRFLNTVAGASVLGILSGTALMLLWTLPIRRASPIHLLPGTDFYYWNYELAAVACYFILTLILANRQTDWVALTCYAVGFGLVSGALVARKDKNGSLQLELIVYVSLAMFVVLLSLFMVGPRLSRAMKFLVQQR